MTTRRAVLLDLDGTLTDSAPGIVNCLRYALDAMGVDHPDDAAIRTFLGPPLAVTFREHFAMSDADVDVAIAKYRERYHDIGLFENEVYDGIPELLTGLAEAGLPLAVATSKPTYSATRILEHFGLARHFAFIGGSDLEGDAPRQGRRHRAHHGRARAARPAVDARRPRHGRRPGARRARCPCPRHRHDRRAVGVRRC